MKIFLLALGVLFAARAHAFPEMVRHGYPNCVSCHVAPAGGGVLTAYGRVLSAELLSTGGDEKEGAFLYGAIRTPEFAAFGGDFRALWYTSPQSVGKMILMQSDLEAALSYQSVTGVATLGLGENSVRGDGVISRRHYLQYQWNDAVAIRAGKFLTAIGLMPADHQIVTRRGLGWDQGSETYNAELSYSGEDADVFVSGQFGSPFTGDNKEQGIALRAAGHFADTHRVGMSYFYGNRSGHQRHVAGPFAALGITPHFFILAELDYQKLVTEQQDGGMGYLRVDYEFVRGLHGYLTSEYSRTMWSKELTAYQSHGVGIQFFPRPHFEINAFYQKQRTRAISGKFGDFLGVMAHIYL